MCALDPDADDQWITLIARVAETVGGEESPIVAPGHDGRLPEIRAIYQLHRNVTVGAQENTDPDFIANADEKCQGASIKLAVAKDSKSYTVTVGSQGK